MPRPTASPLLTCLACLALLAAPAAADVIVLDEAGGGDFTLVVDAVDAAADGDIILVRSGDYVLGPSHTVQIGGKSLTLVGDGPTRPVLPITQVFDLPLGGQVVLRGLEVRSTVVAALTGGSLVVGNCAGSVVVEDCVVLGEDGVASTFAASDGRTGLRIFGSDQVVLARCTIRGGQGADAVTGFNRDATNGGAAVFVVGSRVLAGSVEASGGHGGSGVALSVPGGDGGVGLRAEDAEVWLSGCDVSGGELGDGATSGVPAPAASLAGAGARLYDLDDAFVPGAGATAIDLQAGADHVAWSGGAVEFVKSGPVRPGDLAAVEVRGPPGTIFGLFYSLGGGFIPKLSLHGVFVPSLLLGGPLIVDVIPAGGEYLLPFPVPAVAGVEGFVMVDQLITSQGADGLIVSGVTTFIQVDAGF